MGCATWLMVVVAGLLLIGGLIGFCFNMKTAVSFIEGKCLVATDKSRIGYYEGVEYDHIDESVSTLRAGAVRHNELWCGKQNYYFDSRTRRKNYLDKYELMVDLAICLVSQFRESTCCGPSELHVDFSP